MQILGRFVHGRWHAVRRTSRYKRKLEVKAILSQIQNIKVPPVLASLQAQNEVITIPFNKNQTLYISKAGLFFVDTEAKI